MSTAPTIPLDGHVARDTHRTATVEGPNFTSAGHAVADTQSRSASGGETNPVPADQWTRDAQRRCVGGDGTNPTDSLDGQGSLDTQSRRAVEGPNPVPADQPPGDTHRGSVGGDGPSSDDGQTRPDTQGSRAVVAPTPEQANARTVPIAHAPARDPLPPAPAKHGATPTSASPVLADPLLRVAAEALDDIESTRTANENRLRQLTRTGADKDGKNRGFGLTLEHPMVHRQAAIVRAMKCDSTVAATEKTPKRLGCCLEHDAERALRDQLKQHPLFSWLEAQRGVGDKQGARLLAAIRDPYWNDLHSRPRTVSELWAYCGYVPGQRRRKGQRDNWSADAKKRAFVIAKSCLQQLVKPCYVVKDEDGAYLSAVHVDGCKCSPYRVFYDEGRERYWDSPHPEPCARCGPAGKPAPAGSIRSGSHQDQMALRFATKRLLRDLWREAKRLHEQTP